jgi:signal transduction histidine kinase
MTGNRDFSYLASLAVYTFGALTLSVLTAFYWSQRRRHAANQSAVLPVFTLVCAVAFVNNVLYQSALFQGAAMLFIRNVAAGLVPPLMLHLVVEFRWGKSPGLRWRRLLLAFYTACVGSTIVRGLNETGLLSTGDGALYFVPAVLLASASLLGTLLLATPQRSFRAIEHAHRRALLVVLIPLFACAVANLGEPGPIVRQMPDYLVLSFFCITLYFRERLAFFDLLVKRGAFLAAGLVIFFACLATGTSSVFGMGALLLVLWLTGPVVYARIDRFIDAVWLRRPYSPADAERQFIREIQAANTEEELLDRAARSLNRIFRAAAEVRFQRPFLEEGVAEEESLATGIQANGSQEFSIVIAPRPDGIPFLSDDRRLFQSLAGALGMVLENVRFRTERRSQEEREQQLLWLTNRAELKALRAQVNPHFLFNALSVITGLVQCHPELAAETIEELAQVFRYVLRKSDREWAPLAEEVEFVTAYLHVEQARFGERLNVELHLDPAVDQILIPAMSIQPLVENAIKHGISDQEEGGTVGLRTAIEGDLVSIEVFDSGPGFPPGFALNQKGGGHGLRNVMERLRGYYGDAAQLWWESGPNRTRVVLTLPQIALCGADGGDAGDPRADRR